jgi:hypothetical protein
MHGGNLDLDVTAKAPNGEIVYSVERTSDGYFSHDVGDQQGPYEVLSIYK